MTAPGLVCGQYGTELPPNAKSYNESAVPSYRVRWTGLSPRLAVALPDFLLPCGSNLLTTSAWSNPRPPRCSPGSGPQRTRRTRTAEAGLSGSATLVSGNTLALIPDSHSTTSDARSTYTGSSSPPAPRLVSILGSVTTGRPWILPTTCWLATSSRIPAAFHGRLASGRNSGRCWLSSRARNQPQRRGCMTTASGGWNRVV